MSFLAPAGTPVSPEDIWQSLRSNRPASSQALAVALRGVSGAPFVMPISSGRAAMTLVLRAMRAAARDAARNEVLIPAYTCYSVPASVERAGLKPRLCDVDARTLGIDPAALARCDFARVLAVVSSNLYGLPNDLAAIEKVCHEQGVFMLDDAAQALGARIGARAAGSFGDAGLFSFDKGKIISTMQGGAIVANGGVVQDALAREISTLSRAGRRDAIGNLAKLAAYSVLLRPELYGFVRWLPFTGLGHTVYETRYPIARLADFQVALAAMLMQRLDQLNTGRRVQAAHLLEALRDMPGVVLVKATPGAVAAYARFPLRVANRAHRSTLIRALNSAGIGATTSYPQALADVPEVVAKIPAADRHCPGARELAATIVTLPTHAYCPPDYAARVREVVNKWQD